MKKTTLLRVAACVLFACVFVYAGYNIIRYYTQEQAAAGAYTSLQTAVSAVPSTTTGTAADAPSAPQPTQPTVPITVDFDSLLASCPDVVGWLYIPDTPISYPVVQGEDNDAYLHRLPTGEQNDAGSLFADYRNIGADDRNYLIYGHSMKNGTMFGTLEHFARQDHFDAHPVAYYITSEASYIIHLYAGYTTDAASDAYTLIHTEESFATYMAAAKERSDFVSDVAYTPGDTVITLSTCAYDHEDARYVLLGIPEKVEVTG